jgi:hypothetical protein
MGRLQAANTAGFYVYIKQTDILAINSYSGTWFSMLGIKDRAEGSAK